MSRLDAEKLARLYDGFYAEQDQPSNPFHTSALETLAGFAVLVLVAVIFGVML